MKYILAIVFSVFLSSSANAKDIMGMLSSAAGNCMKETVSININYNLKGKSFDEIKKLIDEQNAKIEEYAKQQKLTKFELQGKNYNISASASSYDPSGRPESFQYNGNGNVSYNLDSSDAAFKFCEFLISQKIQVSMNSNMYNQGNCGNSEGH
jgi:hypothetical protein